MRAPEVIAAGRWRRRLAATLALVVAIAVVVAIILGTKSPSSLNADAETHNHSSGETTVKRRELVQTDTESGTLSYANPQTVYNRMSGTITWLPSVGQVIKPGQALYRVDGAPVILMDGTTPAYRNLSSSDSDGQDILQLNRNLVALGFNPDGIVVDDVWQPATTAGVEAYQESLGETQTGSISLGQIVFLPGAQVISTVDATVGSDGSGGGSNPSGSSASDERSTTPAPEYVGLTTTSTTTSPAPTPSRPKAQHKHHRNSNAQTIATLKALLNAATAQLQAETAQLRAAQAGNNPNGHNGGSNNNAGNSGPHNSSSNNNSGNSGNSGSSGSSGNSGNSGGGGNATAILHTTSTRLVVTVDLDATKQSEAKVGEPVTVELPNGDTVNGKVTAVSRVAQSSSNNGNGNNGNGSGNNGNSGNNGSGNGSSGATVPVTVGLSGHQAGAGLDQAAVSVNFAEAKATGVLSVPVTALLATAGGGYAVQPAAAPHTLIPVTTGLFAAGYVEITGSGVYPGLAVTDSQG